MAIDFDCPSCGNTLSVPDDYAGKQGTCPDCGAPLAVPSAPPPVPAGAAAAAGGAGLSKGLLAGIAAAVVVVAGAAVVVPRILRRGDREAGAENGEEEGGGETAHKSTYTGPKLELAVRFKPGRYTNRETQKQWATQTVSMGAMSQETTTESTMLVEADVVIRPPDPASGERRIDYTCTRVKMSQKQNGNVERFDSEAPEESTGGLLASALRPLVGWRGVQVHSRDGKFLRLEGLEHLLSEMSSAAGGPQALGMMRRMLEPLLKEVLTRHWGKLLPHEPVGPGDAWERRIDLQKFPMFGPVNFDFSCRMLDVEETPRGKVAVLQCDGRGSLRDRKLDLEFLPLPPGAEATAESMSFETSMVVRFDLDIGLATEVDGRIKMRGDLAINAGSGPTVDTHMQQRADFTYLLSPVEEGEEALRPEVPGAEPAPPPETAPAVPPPDRP